MTRLQGVGAGATSRSRPQRWATGPELWFRIFVDLAQGQREREGLK